jgi:carbamoyl-phosphate synthase large subunit
VVLPRTGTIFLSLTARTKRYVVPLGQKLRALGFQIVATAGTAQTLEEAGLEVKRVRKLQEGHPNLLDYLIDGQIQLIINTPSGKGARTDEGRIRAAAVAHGVPCITTIPAAEAALRAMEALRDEELSVQALQDRFPAVAKEV